MKKRSLSIFVGLFCLVMALCAVPVVAALIPEEKGKGVRIEYGLHGRAGAYRYNNNYYDNYYKFEQQKKSYEEYFRVVVPSGATVTYKEGKNMVAAECEGSNKDTNEDYYYFKLPKKGEKEICVKQGSEEVKLKAVVGSQKGVTKTVAAMQAKYEPNAEGYEYGRITASVDGVPSGGKKIYVYRGNCDNLSGILAEEFWGDYYGYKEYAYKYYDDSGTIDSYIPDFRAYVADTSTDEFHKDYRYYYYDAGFAEYYHPFNMKSEDKENDAARMNAFIKPFLREGGTVIIEPCCDVDLFRGGRDGYYSGRYGTCTWKDSYYDIASISDTELRVNLVTDTYKFKAAKVKIPKQKNPPKVKVDAVKGTIGLNNSMEYRFRKYDEKGVLGAWDEWTKGTSGMKLMSVANGAVASGGIIQVRLARTDKALYSKSLNINIPSQSAVDTAKIKWEGVTTKGSITISDWNKDTKPYEYTTTAPSDSTKWTTVKKGKITFTKKKPAAGTIYIREKGINENTKKKLELKLPSAIASATVSGSGIPSEKIVAYSGK